MSMTPEPDETVQPAFDDEAAATEEAPLAAEAAPAEEAEVEVADEAADDELAEQV